MEPVSADTAYRLIHDIYVLLDAGDRKVLSFFGLTTSQYRVLSLLASDFAYRMTDLSDLMLCARSTITRLIDSLEQSQLVQRDPDAVDRRAQQVILTPLGRELYQRVQQAHDLSLVTRLGTLEADERAELVRRLTQVRDSLRATLDS